jgi:hypothetical protein
MNSDDMRKSIEPNSDQLNADDLIGGPIIVTVNDVKRGPSAEQPIEIEIEGHRPFRPCKTMRRVLIACWGDDGRQWIGRSMKLYCDPDIKFGGVTVGGIRVSHLSGIPARRELLMTTARSKRAPYVIEPLGNVETITDGQAADIIALADEVGADMQAFLKYLGIDTIQNIPASKHQFAVSQLEKKRRKLSLRTLVE